MTAPSLHVLADSWALTTDCTRAKLAADGAHLLGLSHSAADESLEVLAGLLLDPVARLTRRYPTMAEALKLVAISRYKDLHKLSCCAE